MEPSVPFDTLAKFVDAEDVTDGKLLTFDLPLEKNNETSKLASQNLPFKKADRNPEFMLTQTIDSNIKSKTQLRKYCKYCHQSEHSISNCF